MGGGKYQAAGVHPQEFLTTLSSRVAAEGEGAQALLTQLIHDARTARDANSKADFDEDPNEVVNRGQMLDQLSNGTRHRQEGVPGQALEGLVYQPRCLGDGSASERDPACGERTRRKNGSLGAKQAESQRGGRVAQEKSGTDPATSIKGVCG